MSARLWRRRLEVGAGVRGDQARVWRELSTRARVRHTRSRRPSDAEVEIRNLSADSRAWLEATADYAWVRAGYDPERTGRVLPVLIEGTVTSVRSEREGPDWITTLEVSDGEGVYGARARVSRSFRAVARGTALRQVLDDVAAVVRPDVAGLDADLVGDVWGELVTCSVSGPLPAALDRLMPRGWSWTVLDGVLRVGPETSPLTTTATLLSPRSGLIGSPQLQRDGRRRLVEVVSLLVPELRPGQLVVVDGVAELGGEYVCREVEHVASTWQQDWYSTLTLTPRGSR